MLPRSSFYPFPSIAFPSAGAVDKLVLPEGMQNVNVSLCYGLTGTAESHGMSEGHSSLKNGLAASRSKFVIPHFILSLTFVLTVNSPFHTYLFNPSHTSTGKLLASERAKVKNYSGP